MRSKALLIELIELLDEFESGQVTDAAISLREFTGFLNARNSVENLPIRDLTGGLEQEMIVANSTAAIEISRLVSVMYHYAKIYIKKALRDSAIQSADEFTFLIILMTHEHLSKTELISKNIIEKTSGTDIIRRLINKGLVLQYDDENDKRCRLVRITEKGKKEIFAVLPGMNVVSRIVAGNLSETEQHTLAYLLKKLDYYHNELYLQNREAALEDIFIP